MMVRENIRMAVASMAGSRLRTFLSLLGIMIGVASVVAILNLGRSVTESMSSSFEVGGLDTISIMPRGAARETMIFTEEFAYSLMNEIDGIREVLPVVSSAANVRNGQEISEGVMIQGVTSDYFGAGYFVQLYALHSVQYLCPAFQEDRSGRDICCQDRRGI